MLYKGMHITEDTLSTIIPEGENDIAEYYTLTIYKDCKVVFEKVYKTLAAAEQVNTKMIKKYDLLK